MIRVFWGVVLVVVGALFALQTFGILAANLTFWPVVLTIVGISLAVRGLFPSPYRMRSGPAWMKLSIGLWLASIGILDILHANQITALSGSNVWSAGWFIVLIGAGLALIFGNGRRHSNIDVIDGDNGRGSSGWGKYNRGWQWLIWTDPDFYLQGGGVGDLHYGRDPWVVDGKLNVKHRIGDVRIDLTSAQIGDGSHDINVAAAVGEIVILVPTDCNANVRARVGTGGLNVFGERRDGLGAVLEKSANSPGATVTLNINARLRVGEVSVRRVPNRQQED